jgi:anti-sigma factor RsiW
MNDCTAFSDELVDVAFGIAPSHALTQHMDSCPACSANFESRRALAQRIDMALQARIQLDPPPYLAERIVAHARRAQPRRWSGIRFGVRIAATLAVIFVLVMFGIYRSASTHRELDTGALMAWRSPTASLLTQNLDIVRTPLDIHLEHVL